MECKVNLGADKFVGIKDRFIAERETILVFESTEYPLDELHVTISDGRSSYRHTVKSGRLDIAEYCRKATTLEIKVGLVLRGKIAKNWLLEPFVVEEVIGGYEMIPEIALLRNEIQTMKLAIRELNSKIDDTM
jgi:hypothetical protein